MTNQRDHDAALSRFHEAEERVRITPPRCLCGFQVKPSALSGMVFDGHGEPLNAVFQLRCACDGEQFLVLGHHKTNQGHSIFVSPLALRCSACSKTTELIDTNEHGYDPELGHRATTIRGEGERTPYACPECGVRPMSAHARFEHSGEVLEDSYGDFSGRQHQDLFTWFSLVGECSGCKQVLYVADFECA